MALLATLPLSAEELDSDSWDIRLSGPGSGVQKTEEGLALLYRPHLVSKRKWRKDTSVSLEAKPSKAVKADDGKMYGDSLCFVIRGTGKFRKKRSYETLDGIVGRIDFVTGDMYLQVTKDGESFENLVPLKRGDGPLSPEEWHKISYGDTGTDITLTVGKATLTAKIKDSDPTGEVWALYNREPTGPGRKVLEIRNVNYTTPPQ